MRVFSPSDAADEVTDGEGADGVEALHEARGVDADFGLLFEEVAGGEGFAIGADGEACHERTAPWAVE